ncbi:MAG: MerR family transcriptional regulator [Myxococcales bacterium]|nr:MerR family transcriptional regulator [Myxococcales bacterium]
MTTPTTSIDHALHAGGPHLGFDGDALIIGGAGRVEALVARRRRGDGAQAPRDQLTEADLRAIEDTYADGITAVQIVEVFVSRGIRFSEATFRKYVQQGLLPRSRRIGRKGKNKGSLGMYPAKTVRRIDHVKRLMGEGYTIEQIQAQFLQFTDLVENVSEAIDVLLERLDEDLAAPALEAAARRGLAKDMAEARRLGEDLVTRLTALTQRALAPRAAELRKAGAADDAEDLL